jgi:hypothetical protein
MKNWTKCAEAMQLDIPAADIEGIAASLDSLEAVFRPLVATIPPDVEPAVIFRAAEETE